LCYFFFLKICANFYQEPIETRSNLNDAFDIESDGKLHVLYGGTIIVQNTPPLKNDPGLRGINN
jgi:manganese-transporting P-type ATPase